MNLIDGVFHCGRQFVQLGLQRGQLVVANVNQPLEFAVFNIIGDVFAVNINAADAAAGIRGGRTGLCNGTVRQLVRIAVQQRNAAGRLNNDFAAFPLEIGNVYQSAQITQSLVALVFQICHAIISQNLVFDNLVIEVLQVVQQVVNLVAGFADAQIGIAAQFLNFRRQGIKAGSDRIGVVQQIIAPRR